MTSMTINDLTVEQRLLKGYAYGKGAEGTRGVFVCGT